MFDNAVGFTARKNSTGSIFGPRTRLNLIEGTGVTLTVSDDSTNDEVDVTIDASGGSSDHKVMVSSDDTTPDYLENKLSAGNGIALTELNEGGNETEQVAVSLNSGEATGTAGNQAITGSSSFADIAGLSLSLTAGKWLITADVSGQCEVQDASGGMPVSSYGYMVSRLYNNTDSAAIASTERVFCSSSKYSLTVGYAIANGPGASTISKVITLAGTKTIRVQAERVLSAGDSSFVNSDVWRDRCLMTAVQIA